MKLTKFNVVSLCLVILVILTMIGRIFDMQALSDYAWILVFPFFAYLYYGLTKGHNHFFGFFLNTGVVIFKLKQMRASWRPATLQTRQTRQYRPILSQSGTRQPNEV